MPVLHGIHNTRRSATVYGAIGTYLKEPVYLVITADDCRVDPETGKKESKSTNQKHFAEFLRLVARAVAESGLDKPLLLYDGHTAHTNPASKALIDEYFEPLQQVPYSSPFNCIETLWSIAKRIFHKRLLLEMQPISEAEMKEHVLHALHSVTPAQLAGVLRANLSYLREFLEKDQLDPQ